MVPDMHTTQMPAVPDNEAAHPIDDDDLQSAEDEDGEPKSGRGRRRRPRVGLTEQLRPRFTPDERGEVDLAAASAGMSTSRFCAEAALAAARGTPMSMAGVQDREALARLQRQLFAARTAVVRFGTNVNQAVAALNSTGEAPNWLDRAAALTVRSMRRLDAVIAVVDRRLR
jgi:hypothetical protein